MSNIKDRLPHDENGKPHGEWITYHNNGQLAYYCNWVHGKKHGLQKNYYYDGSLQYYGYWEMDKQVNYLFYWCEKIYFLFLI